MSTTSLNDLSRYPIVQAPMAGGASCPELAGAVCEAGALGFLAGGLKTAGSLYQEIKRVRRMTARPFGVNLFMPASARPADPAAVEVYRHQLAGEITWYETPLGDADDIRDDAYDAKLAILLEDPVPVVSFTFGCPTPEALASLARAGTYTIVTVTSAEEALTARQAGADAVCVQGIEAGGHQGTFRDDPADDDTRGTGLLTLLTQVRDSVPLPIVAAGGIMRGAQIAAVLAAGADAAQLGTAFLPCPESGALPLHKAALTDPLFTRTALTRAFSGRQARGLVNRFLREHGPYAPAAYPEVQHLTAPLRKAAANAGDAQGLALWAGQGHRLARDLPAGQLVGVFAAELDTALAQQAPRSTT
ncbi:MULTISPECIES: nitronate monooxygenase [unclassified Streptomyces]|uniref:nitronate monooxygenase n=1 Tax=unclassified Streptomyces TaxID=2593676 RepID=UPI0016603730|nr:MULTISPECIES: nitronate monooxygenase [unclassified Streptomyces]MBD0711223.1 2-nitropropane dioxygenase [Streptomyces sp. CBMA291]MBD0717412.1 2-nitropropane dioxygenase [Streptomyces sp. CBMA370]